MIHFNNGLLFFNFEYSINFSKAFQKSLSVFKEALGKSMLLILTVIIGNTNAKLSYITLFDYFLYVNILC